MMIPSNSLPQLAIVAKKEDEALHYSGIKNVQVQNLLWKGLAGEVQGVDCLKNNSCTANMFVSSVASPKL